LTLALLLLFMLGMRSLAMKKLVVSLLSITFLLAACGGHDEPASVTASSTSAPIAADSSSPPAPTSTVPAPAPATSPAPSAVAIAPNGNGALAITNYRAARGTSTSPIIQQQPQQAVNLAEVLASVPRIKPQEAKAQVDSGKALIVDVRSIIRRQIKGSRHIPLAQLPLLMKDLPKDKTIITYCTCPHEEEATRGALELKQAGFKAPVALGGGLNAWENAGFPTEPPQ
jgi:rhodanese-related sulfurtransferase